MKCLSVLFLLTVSPVACANDPFDPTYFQGTYYQDPSRSDSSCPIHSGEKVVISAKSKALVLESPGFTAGIQGINEPPSVFDGEDFFPDHQVSSAEYDDHILKSNYTRRELPVLFISVTDTVKKNSDGSIEFDQSVFGYDPTDNSKSFTCTLMTK